MDLHKMIAELRDERARVIEATLVVERLAGTTPKGPGRPRKSLSDAVIPHGTERKRKPFSAATKRKMAKAQKARWAAKKKAAE